MILFSLRLCDLSREWNPFAQLFHGLRYFKFSGTYTFWCSSNSSYQWLLSTTQTCWQNWRLICRSQSQSPRKEVAPPQFFFYPQRHIIVCWMFAVINISRIRQLSIPSRNPTHLSLNKQTTRKHSRTTIAQNHVQVNTRPCEDGCTGKFGNTPNVPILPWISYHGLVGGSVIRNSW